MLSTALVGRTNLANLLAATAVALECDVPLDAIAAQAATLRPASRRGEVIRLASGVVVIDDSYNANPTATRRAIDVLRATPARRRVAVIGEMLELGDRAIELHEEVGRAAAAAHLDAVFTVGGSPADALAQAAIDSGMDRSRVRQFGDSDAAATSLVQFVEAGDVVLVKGSRGVKTDRVVDRLRAERG
jgi:UDP-N-acetylmuramoyl-tripeptide--D-alanyl-D-alanine ligase